MITIKPNSSKTLPKTTLNEIPVGTTFSGEVWSGTRNEWTSGLFVKTWGVWFNKDSLQPHDVMVVQLDRNNFWTTCQAVKNYQPVDLIIEVIEK